MGRLIGGMKFIVGGNRGYMGGITQKERRWPIKVC